VARITSASSELPYVFRVAFSAPAGFSAQPLSHRRSSRKRVLSFFASQISSQQVGSLRSAVGGARLPTRGRTGLAKTPRVRRINDLEAHLPGLLFAMIP